MGTLLENICGNTAIFVDNQLLNITYPEITKCFQHTILVWVPCGLLWLSLPYYIFYLMDKRNGVPLPNNIWNVSKTIISLLLCFMMVVDVTKLSFTPDHQDRDQSAVFLGSTLKLVTFIVTIALTQLMKIKGVVTSGFLFIFWLMMFATGVIPCYSVIVKETYERSLFTVVFVYMYFTLVVMQFVLHCFADKPPVSSSYEKKTCPEIYASFPSKLLFWWVNSLILKGFRQSLTEADLWDLRPQDKSEKVSPKFEKVWNQEVISCDRHNTLRQRKTVRCHQDTGDNSTELVPLNTTEGKVSGECKEEKCDNSQKRPSLLKVIVKTHGKDTLKGMCTLMLFDLLEFVNPILLGMLISYIQNKDTEPVWKGYTLACLFYVNAIVMYAVSYHNDCSMKVLGLRLKSALVSAVYKKALVMNNETKKKSTVGEIVNLISVDCDRMDEINFNIMFCFSVPFRICLCMLLLWNIFGPIVLAGVSVIFLLIPINAFLYYHDLKLNRELMEQRDYRCKLVGEVLNGIKVIKLYAWEISFKQKILDIRNKELSILWKLLLVDACYVFSYGLVPFLVGLISFTLYIFTQEENFLGAEKAFVALSLFENLQWQMFLLPYIITYLTQARVSMGRISRYLGSGELDPEVVKHQDMPGIAIKIEDGTFCWGEIKKPVLKGIDLEIPKGKLTAIVGQVGAGKSSFLSSCIGEMDKICGTVTINGSVAYVPQIAWIQNESVRENILFGTDMNWEKYQNVVNSCCLRPDFEMFTAGDISEIGEKGINLSGGQKQRVSLARAVYYNADIYIMDDPLSAVDSHVGKRIFDEIIGEKGLLQNKTRILVTHGLKWLPKVDNIIVLTDGRISEMGSYDDLLNHNGAFSKFLRTYILQNNEEEENESDGEVQEIKTTIIERLNSLTSDQDDDDSGEQNLQNDSSYKKDYTNSSSHRCLESERENIPLDFNSKPRFNRGISCFDENGSEKQGRCYISNSQSKIDVTNGQTIQDEEVETGEVNRTVYLQYIRLFGIFGFIISVLLVVIEQLAASGGHILLSRWTEDPLLTNRSYINSTEYKSRSLMYIGIYAGFGIGKNVFDMLNTLITYRGTVHASRQLHAKMLDTILRQPMSFFDTTPSGRILNRFSSDVEKIDKRLPENIRMVIYRIINAIITIIVICFNTPVFLSIILPVAVLYFLIQRYYIPASCQLERLESKTLSPVYSHLGETVNGSTTIRAFRQQERFILQSQKRMDANILSRYSLLVVTEWAGIRLDYVGNIFVLGAALFVVMSADISAGVAGLCVTYALEITGTLNDLVRQWSDLETSTVSVERVKEYSEIETEASWINLSMRPPANWPNEGNIRIQNFKTRYRHGLELVLRGVSFQIKGGEKVGIVGRTGAGKSSLMSSLFRLMESVDGAIIIDGLNISDIGLHDLRSKLTILPQDPVLFSGSLRMNLDPFDDYGDDELWAAVAHAHLKSFVSSLNGELLFECGEGGQNLSVGQRQLMCLARALLHKTKILVLDEATAAVDMETDDLIQETIRTEFKDCTVLTIAHRLNTIMDYDKILVLDQGIVVEFDNPSNLLGNKESVFYKMAKDSNIV